MRNPISHLVMCSLASPFRLECQKPKLQITSPSPLPAYLHSSSLGWIPIVLVRLGFPSDGSLACIPRRVRGWVDLSGNKKNVKMWKQRGILRSRNLSMCRMRMSRLTRCS